MPIAIAIAIESPDQPEIKTMLAAADAHFAARYPADANHLLDIASLCLGNVIFMVARIDGVPFGCGALVGQGDDCSELKRMYVDPRARGQRLGVRLLDALETAARDRGHRHVRLETGDRQSEALGLYRTRGYRERGPFGDYVANAHSIYMEKAL